MDTVQLFTLGLAAVFIITAFYRRSAAGRPRLSPAVPTVEVSDPAMARRMLVEHADRFSNRPFSPFPVEFVTGPRANLSHSISTAHGPLWRAFRCNLTAGILHPSRLGLLAPIEKDAVGGLVAGLGSMAAGSADEVVLRDSLHTAMLTLHLRLCFGDGVDASDVRAVQRVLHDFFVSMVYAGELASSRVARLLNWRKWRRFLGIRERMAELILPLVAARRQRRCTSGDGGICPYVDSLLGLQVPTHDDGASTKRALTEDEMVTLVWEFLVAGTETVVSCVEWTLAHLVNQPEVQKKLHHELAGEDQPERQLRELPFMRAVILESLRLHPPVAFVDREVGADGAAVVGATIPAGSTQMRFRVLTGDIGRDSKAWTDADEFRPERFCAGGDAELVGPMPGPKEIRMMPFGAGTRHCPGEGLSMAHVRCFLAALVREFRWEPPTGGGRIDLTEQVGFVTHLKTPLRARITPRI